MKKIFIALFIFIFTINTTNAWLGLTAQNGDLLNIGKWNEMITKLYTKLDQSNITGTGNISVANSGTGVIISFTGGIQSNPIPEISNTSTIFVRTSITENIIINGDDFIPNSTISIPGFDGTINSVSIISQSRIEINLTSTNTMGTYDIVVSNNGVLNTLWAGNGENLLTIHNLDGTTQSLASTSCKTILDDGNSTGDGMYWINPDGGDTSNAFQVYCDMTTDGGGWTRVPYSQDLIHQAHFTDGDTSRYLDSNFVLSFASQQINDIRSVSTEAKQTYIGTCDGVIHYDYDNGNFGYAFGFRYHGGFETANQQATYPNTDITVVADGCQSNNDSSTDTIFEIKDIKLPIINVHSRDNSSTEEFGSALTNNPAWFR